MNTQTKGFWRGIFYPLIALGLHAFLVWITGSGFLSASGALLITALIGKADHALLPTVYPNDTL